MGISKKHPKPSASGRSRWILVALVALLSVGLFPVDASAKYASYVMDADTGEVLHGINENTRNYPASLTKMMTLYLMFDHLRTKRWSMDTKLKVSSRAARQPASKLGLRAGTTISVEQAVLALITKSANDVATVVAENISGRERNFAHKMTAKARSLGMTRTTFRNASGLPNRGQLSTAKDMATLARALMRDFPEHYHLFKTQEFTFEGRTYRNHNKLLKSYPGVDGLKTGYIRASGFNLAASATRDGRRIIGIVFGGRSSTQRNRHMASLLDKGFDKLRQQTAPALIAKSAAPQPKQKVASAPAPRGGEVWAVQVGAFSKVYQARAAAKKAVSKAPSYLANGEIHIVPLKKKSGKVLHRARIVGISKREAFKTCRIIKDCMELQAPRASELAEVQD